MSNLHIAAAWQHFLDEIIPEANAATPAARTMLRRCFFAGAISAIDATHGSESAELYDVVFDEVVDELAAFIQADDRDLMRLVRAHRAGRG